MLTVDISAPYEDTQPKSQYEYTVSSKEDFYSRDCVASKLYTVASRCTNPACWCSSYIHRVLSPLLFGEYDFCATKERELISRFFYSLKIFFVGPISVPLAGLGAGLRYLGAFIQENEFCHFRGSLKEKKKFDKLSIMTWNICGIGGGMERSHGGVLEWETRLDDIVAQIKKENPDILCLQEVVDTDLCDALLLALNKDYAHFYIHLGRGNMIGPNSGNFVAIKTSVNNFEFHPFESATGCGKWQIKGFASFTLKNHKGKKIQIITSHLQHGEDPAVDFEAVETRKEQFKQILQYCKDRRFANRRIPVLIAGDLNVDKKSQEYKDSVLSTHFKHGYDYKESTYSNYLKLLLWDSSYEDREKGLPAKTEDLDYVSFLALNPQNNQKLTTPQIQVRLSEAFEVEAPEKARSDHHALFGVILLEGQ